MEGPRAAPFCRAPDGGRFLVDVTGPFLAKFGGMLSPNIRMVAAVVRDDGPRVIAAMGSPGGRHADAEARSAMALETLAGVIGATAWPGQAWGEVGAGEHEVAATEIVAGLSVKDIAAQMPYAVSSLGAAKRNRKGRSGT